MATSNLLAILLSAGLGYQEVQSTYVLQDSLKEKKQGWAEVAGKKAMRDIGSVSEKIYEYGRQKILEEKLELEIEGNVMPELDDEMENVLNRHYDRVQIKANITSLSDSTAVADVRYRWNWKNDLQSFKGIQISTMRNYVFSLSNNSIDELIDKRETSWNVNNFECSYEHALNFLRLQELILKRWTDKQKEYENRSRMMEFEHAFIAWNGVFFNSSGNYQSKSNTTMNSPDAIYVGIKQKVTDRFGNLIRSYKTVEAYKLGIGWEYDGTVYNEETDDNAAWTDERNWKKKTTMERIRENMKLSFKKGIGYLKDLVD